jgi:hypothetical protein
VLYDLFCWRVERYVNNFDILRSPNYLSRNSECDRIKSRKIYFPPKRIRVRFISRIFKPSLSELGMLQVDTLGNVSISSEVELHCHSTANQLSFKV